MKTLYLALAVAAILFFTLGCAQQQPAPPQEQNQQQAQQPSVPSQPSAQPQGGQAEPQDFASYANLGKSSKYALTTEMGIVVDNKPFGNKTIYKQYRSGDKLRAESVANPNSISFELSDHSYICTNEAEKWSCDDITDLVNKVTMDSSGMLLAHPEKYKITPDGTMQVAGTTATCFKSDDVAGSKARVCFSQEGATLYSLADMPGSTIGGKPMQLEITATSYSTTVDENVFALPAQPKGQTQQFQQNPVPSSTIVPNSAYVERVSGLSKTYSPGQVVSYTVIGMITGNDTSTGANEKPTSPDEGFGISADLQNVPWTTNSIAKSYGKYNNGVWTVTFTVPETPGNYQFVTCLSCTGYGTRCSSLYGVGVCIGGPAIISDFAVIG